MDVTYFPSLYSEEYLHYIDILNSGNILLTGGRTASKLFEEWVRKGDIEGIAGRYGGYDEDSECGDYYYFYGIDDDIEDQFAIADDAVESFIANMSI